MAKEPEDRDFLSPDALADVPLLREIQRVLLAGHGPVNWELARQIGIAVAVGSGDDPAPTEEDRQGLEDTVRAAELAVSDLTGLFPPGEVATVRAVRRAEWVEANARGLRGLFEPAAERMARALAESERAEEGEEQPAQGLAVLVERLVPLLMGAQVGAVLGALAGRVFGQYELPLPRTDQSALLFVVPNIAAFEREWSLPPIEFRAWVALHETTHAFDLARAWVRDHLVGLVRDLAGSMEFDLAGLQERLAGLDLSDPQRVAEALSGDLLGGEMNDEQRLRLRRVQAFMAAVEGHADHVMDTVGSRMLGSYGQIDEAIRRRTGGPEERVIEQLLGVDLKLEQYRLGRVFCDRVVELTDEQTLSRMWDSAESLPSMPELEEPTLWLSRIS